MTRNLYLGADLTPTINARSVPDFIAAVTKVYSTVQATDFPERAEALADEIADTDPHVIGLQEVELWRSQTPADFAGPNATDVEFDFLDLLLEALAARGAHYTAAVVLENFDIEAPRSTAAGFQDVRLTDRDAILVRSDLPPNQLEVKNAQSQNFVTNVSFTLPSTGTTIVLRRGWTSVDVALAGTTVRVINTHLERIAPPVQVAQANEILAGPADTTLPVVFVGDLNSAAGEGGVPGQSDTPTYNNVIGAGFSDAWSAKRGDAPGFTCCQAEDLRNDASTLTERIDLILVRGDFKAATVVIEGEEVEDKTPKGLWPSDHAGVWAVLVPG